MLKPDSDIPNAVSYCPIPAKILKELNISLLRKPCMRSFTRYLKHRSILAKREIHQNTAPSF